MINNEEKLHEEVTQHGAVYGVHPVPNGGISSVTDSGTLVVCEHTEHDDTCSYAKAVDGTDCTHQCELCKPAEEITPPAVKDCDCTVKCTLADEESINADCPVCAVENADLTECMGEQPMAMIMPLSSDTPNGTPITTALDFATNSGDSDCTTYSGISHTHSDPADKCFTWASNPLTLNNLNLTTSDATAITLPFNATVNMGADGSVSTVTSTNWEGNNSSRGIFCPGGVLTLCGSGSLTATGGTATNGYSYGVYSDANITVSGGTFEAKSTSDTGTAQAVNKAPITKGYTNVKLSAGALNSLTVVSDLTGFANYKHIKIEPAAGVTEQFNLTNGGTYYFDLSGETANIGTINDAVPDTSLHYVPFTYVGTVNAYSLDSSSSGQTGASATAGRSPTDRSLFVADYNVSHTVSWDDLNKASLIFGKTFDTNYKLRSLSVGSSRTGSASDGSDYVGQPNTNEWDQILDKSSDYIKHWSNIYSWGQSPNIITCNGEKDGCCSPSFFLFLRQS